MKFWKKWTKKLCCLTIATLLSGSFVACGLGEVLEDVSSSLESSLVIPPWSDTDSSFDTENSSNAGDEDSSSENSASDSSSSSNNSSEDSSSEGDNSSEDSSSEGDNSSEDSSSEGDNSSEDSSSDSSSDVVEEKEELQIYFPSFQNKVSGDCTLIKVGDTEVLIDAGSTRGSAKVIVPYIQQYCTDGVLEYVIATHAHEDHIAAFVGENGTDGVFANFECETIIDYTKKKTTSQVSKDYENLRDKEVQAGAVHYTALECWNNANGAQRSYQLGDDITLNILYQKYYETSTSNENNYSVCTMISYGEKHFLFTGDLESGGEASLIENNDLPVCELFKSGHHGSNTSNSAALLSVIQPKTIIITCCCGDKFDFPNQEMINRIAPYTDKVYAPSVSTLSGAELLNGNITVFFDGKNLTVDCSNNNILFKDSEWFKKNRTTPNQWK